jgi:hypothetical protein
MIYELALIVVCLMLMVVGYTLLKMTGEDDE